MKVLEALAKRKKLLLKLALAAGAVALVKATILAPPLVSAVRMERRDLAALAYGNGTVEAKVVVPVSSTVTGRITALYADQGDVVRRGQILARLENDDLLHQESQSRAGVGRAEAQLAVERATLEKAHANLELAERNARRFASLADGNLVARLEAEQYENAHRVAREEVARAAAALEAARREEEASRSGLGIARSRVRDTLIYAPQDGMVVSRDLELGATATPGLPLFRLADPAGVWVRAHVDEALVGGVALGQEAEITLRSAPGKNFPGRVARVGRESDRVTEELPVEVAFSEPRRDFRIGEQAEVLITAKSVRGVPSLPAAALTARGESRGVWSVAEGRLRFRPVTVGIEDRRNLVEIAGGIDAKTTVVLAPPEQARKFRDGMKVRVRP